MILSAVRAARKGPIPRGYAPHASTYYRGSSIMPSQAPVFTSRRKLSAVWKQSWELHESRTPVGGKTGSGTGAERQKTAGRGAPPSGGFQHELSVTESISWTRCPPTSRPFRPFRPFRWPPTSPRNRRSLRRSQSPRHHRPSSPNASEQPPRGRAQRPRRP